MKADAQVVKSLYVALDDHDGQAMADLYAPDARFGDPVFPDLRGAQIGAMWRMLCGRARDLDVEVRDIEVKSGFASCTWTANYTFAKTGRAVKNVGQARFALREGLITQHADAWDFHAWAGQALGPKGKLLGWTKPFQEKVQLEARAGLDKFMRDE